MTHITTAILIDGGFFVRRLRAVYGSKIATDPDLAAEKMHEMATAHLYAGKNSPRSDLYRILFYDCPPATHRAHLPISKKSIDFSKTDTAKFRLALHQAVLKKRKVALRLGYLDRQNASWKLKQGSLKELIAGQLQWSSITDDDFIYETRQKQIDMKIGLDISTLTERRLVNQVVLVSGDSDFVPAAKMARRGGIDFVLDPMWHNIRPDLHEHIDGLRSTSPDPHKAFKKGS